MSQWQLINPSDAVVFETDDYALAACVTVLLGRGQYAARDESMNYKDVPIMLFGPGNFFEENFGKNGDELLADICEHRPEDLAKVFDSVAYVHDRSSLNAIVARAKAFAAKLRGEDVDQPRAPRQVF